MRRVACLLSAVLLALGIVSVTSPASAAVPTAPPSMPYTVTAPKATASTAGTFHPVELTRVLNTAAGVGARKLAAGASATFRVGGLGAIPTSNVAAVAINLTVPNPTQAGSVAVFAGGTSWTGAETVTFVAGQTEQSSLTQPVGAGGTLTVRNGAKVPVDVIGDVTGYYSAGVPTAPGTFVPYQRLFRPISTVGHPLAPGAGTSYVSYVNDDRIGAVVLNITAFAPAKATTLSLDLSAFYEGGTQTLYLPAGRTQQRMVTVPVNGKTGQYTVLTNKAGAPLSMVIDVIGYFLKGPATDQGQLNLFSARPYDTRTGGHTPIKPGGSIYLFVNAAGYEAAQLDLTVVSPTVRGSLSVYPGPEPWSGAATLSYAAGSNYVRPVTATYGVDHAIRIRNNSTAPLNLVVTEIGSYLGTPAIVDTVTHRLIDPSHGSAQSISCPTATFCAALQGNGFVSTFDGSRWSASTRLETSQDRAATLDLTAPITPSISCASATFCVVAAEQLSIFDGTSWKLNHLAGPNLRSVSCPSPTFCMAVNDQSYETWNGTSWDEGLTGLRGGTVNGHPDHVQVTCVDSNFCIAAHESETAVWNGSSWTRSFGSTLPAEIRSISCVSLSYCVAVGQFGYSARWDGSHWTPLSGDAAAEDDSVSCPSTSFCISVGGDSDAHLGILTAGSTTWTAVAGDAAPAGPRAVSCVSASQCIVLSGQRAVVGLQWNGETLSTPLTIDPGHGSLSGISCAAVDHCVAVDHSGFYFTEDASGWTGPTALPAGFDPASVSCPQTTFCQAAGAAGQVSSFNGTTWTTPAPIETGAALLSVSCASATLCVATDDLGRLLRWNGTAWTDPTAMPGGGLVGSVSCPADGFCMVVSDRATASTWNGTAWSTAVPTGVPAKRAGSSCGSPFTSCVSVTCASADYCLAQQLVQLTGTQTTTQYLVSEWNGSSWRPIPTGPGDAQGVLACGAKAQCADIGYLIDGWNGSQWAPPYLSWGSDGLTTQGSCVGPNFCASINHDAVAATLSLSW